MVTGRVNCNGGTMLCATSCQGNSNYSECDGSTYQENGPAGCAGAPAGFTSHYPTVLCRNIKSTTKTEAYYSCPSGYIKYGTGSSTRCRKTTYRDPYHQSAYYDCPSSTLVGKDMCFRSNF